jgi:hypothetical protein
MEGRAEQRRRGQYMLVSARLRSDASRDAEYKSKGLKQDDLRRRREEQQVEIRRQKREENISKRRNLNFVPSADSDDEGEPPVSEVYVHYHV